MNTTVYTAQILDSHRAATLAHENAVILAQRERGDIAPAPRRGFSFARWFRLGRRPAATRSTFVPAH